MADTYKSIALRLALAALVTLTAAIVPMFVINEGRYWVSPEPSHILAVVAVAAFSFELFVPPSRRATRIPMFLLWAVVTLTLCIVLMQAIIDFRSPFVFPSH